MTPPMVQEIHGASARVGPLWDLLRARLNGSAETMQILSGGKNYLVWEDWSKPEGSLEKFWGRQVLKPSETLWPAVEVDPSYRGVGWLLVSEVWWYREGWNPLISLERLQQLAYSLWMGYSPPVTDGMLVRLPIWRHRAPHPTPQWDEDRRMWWISSEWRTEVTRTI